MTQSDIEEEQHDAAITWFVLLQDCEEEAVWLAHRDWLEADPAHVAAFDAVARMWIEVDDLMQDSASSTAEVIDLDARRDERRRWRSLWRPAAAAAAVIAAVGLLQLERLREPAAETFQTDATATRTIALADGSRVVLNRNTVIRVRLRDHARLIELSSGEAAFDVHRDATRPFSVLANGREVRVLGTEFNVLNQAGAFGVTVRRGLVSISAGSNGGPSVRLPAGTALMHRMDAQTDTLTKVKADDAFAWKDGRLIYVDRPISDIARDLGRYGGDTVAVAPELAAMRASAVLTIGDVRSLDRQLELLLPIRIETTARGRRIVPAP